MVTTLYAGILAVFLICLTICVVRKRHEHKAAIGDHGHKDLAQAIRAHGNFVEYAPFFLILLYVAESNNLSYYALHMIGLLFVIGRASHAYSLLKIEKYDGAQMVGSIKYRTVGMMLTIGAIAILSGVLLYQYISFALIF